MTRTMVHMTVLRKEAVVARASYLVLVGSSPCYFLQELVFGSSASCAGHTDMVYM